MPIISNRKVSIKPDFYLYLAMLLLMLPLRWVLGWFIAVLFHELCHYVVLRAFHIRVFSLKIGVSGFIMETELFAGKQELVVALAGPVGGLILSAAGRWVPCTAICSFLLSVYNLLPIYPLDGGRAVRCLINTSQLNYKQRTVLHYIINIMIAVVIGFISTILFICGYGLLWFVLCLLFLVKNYSLKIPCKGVKQIVKWYGNRKCAARYRRNERLSDSYFTDGPKTCPLHRR